MAVDVIKNRLLKLMQRQDLSDGAAIACIVVNDGKTEVEALSRVYPEDRKKPKTVVYLDLLMQGCE
jgi:hypothetical protein